MAWDMNACAVALGSLLGPWMDLAIKSSALLAAAGVLTLALRRRSAATRHCVWALAFTGLLLLPLFSVFLPAWRITVAAPVALPAAGSALFFTSPLEPSRLPPSQAMGEAVGQLPLEVNHIPAASDNSSIPANGLAATPKSTGSVDAISLAPTFIWAIGFVLGLTPLLGGYIALLRLRQRTRSLAGSRIEEIALALAQQLGIRRKILLLVSNRSCMPMTWGVRRPVILLPLAAERWPLARLRPVLVHELAHVQRFDCMTQMLVQLVRAAYWFNPLVWMAQRHMRLEQESACDDIVLNAGLDAQHYAEQLLTITAGLPAHFLVSSVALAMGKKRTLERRLLAILDVGRDRRVPRGHVLVFALAALAATLAVLAPMRILVGQAGAARAAESLVFLDGAPQGGDQQALAKTLDEVRAKIQALAVEAPAEKVLLEGALRGMLESMHDPYSSYLSASDVMQTTDPSQATTVGIGVQIRKTAQGITVVTPLPDSPARKAGLKPGDIILAINGKSVATMSIADAVKLIRGPANTAIKLTVQSLGHDREVSLQRVAVAIPSIGGYARNADDSWNYLIDAEAKIGYVQIGSFNDATDKEFDQTIRGLDRDGMKGLILDLRFCPGGLFNSSLGVVQTLMNEGNIVSIRSRDLSEKTIAAQGKALLGQRPIVVLVNEQTASGGEIVAGALKENGRAIVIGSRTRGKGSVQTIVNLGGEHGAIKLTTAQLFLPSGRMIQRTAGAKEWGVDPTDGFYLPLSAKQIIALEERFGQRQVMGPPAANLPKANADPADPQLASALKALSAKLTKGEFEKVGRPLSEIAGDLQKIQAEQAKLKEQLAEINRQLEALGAVEPNPL